MLYYRNVKKHNFTFLLQMADYVPVMLSNLPECQNDCDRNRLVQMSWFIYHFSCVTLVSLSSFWRLRCLVVYLYHISSFIKNSVSGAGEKIIREWSRQAASSPPCQEGLLLPSRLAPNAKSLERQEDKRRIVWSTSECQPPQENRKLRPFILDAERVSRIWGLTAFSLGRMLFVLLWGVYSRWHQIRSSAHVFARQTNNW